MFWERVRTEKYSGEEYEVQCRVLADALQGMVEAVNFRSRKYKHVSLVRSREVVLLVLHI